MKRFKDFLRGSIGPSSRPPGSSSMTDNLKGIGMALVASAVPVAAALGPDGIPKMKYRAKE